MDEMEHASPRSLFPLLRADQNRLAAKWKVMANPTCVSVAGDWCRRVTCTGGYSAVGSAWVS